MFQIPAASIPAADAVNQKKLLVPDIKTLFGS